MSILSASESGIFVKCVRSLFKVFRSFELVLVECSDGGPVPGWIRFCNADT